MMEDFMHRFNGNRERVRAMSLHGIGNLLRSQNQSLEVYELPVPRADLLEADRAEEEYAFVDHMVAADDQWQRLNEDQRMVYDRVIQAINNVEEGAKLFYVDGPGGTGKTTLYNSLISTLRARGRSVVSVEFIGIAAILMEGGQTVHKAFGLPFGTFTNDSTSNINLQSVRAQVMRP